MTSMRYMEWRYGKGRGYGKGGKCGSQCESIRFIEGWKLWKG